MPGLSALRPALVGGVGSADRACLLVGVLLPRTRRADHAADKTESDCDAATAPDVCRPLDKVSAMCREADPEHDAIK